MGSGSYGVLTTKTPSWEIMASVLWEIWKSRNTFIFQNLKPDPSTIVDAAFATKKSYERWNLTKDSKLIERDNEPARKMAPLN